MKQALEKAKNIVAPFWPLQNIIAVNPFWNLRSNSFREVFSRAPQIYHQEMYMPLDYYLNKYQSGIIDIESIRKAISSLTIDGQTLNEDEFILKSEGFTKEKKVRYLTFTEYLGDRFYNDLSLNEFSKFAAGYLDSSQSIVSVESDNGFWSWWLTMQKFDHSLSLAGISTLKWALDPLYNLGKHHAISLMLSRMGLGVSHDRKNYFERLFASIPGWSSRFSMIEWEKEKGKNLLPNTSLEDCLAVRLAYDYLMLVHFGKSSQSAQNWLETYKTLDDNLNNKCELTLFSEIWQLAHEISYQKKLISNIRQSKAERPNAKIRMFFCIDVRSEIIRRHIESLDAYIATSGFAGFFGLPASYQRCDQKDAEELLPVLLSPSMKLIESDKSQSSQSSHYTKENQLVLSFLRSLRKGTLSSFAYVELFGCIALERFFKRIYKLLLSGSSDKVPSRFDCKHRKPILSISESQDHSNHPDTSLVAGHLAQILRHMGMSKNFPELVVLAGHGSVCANNAFASSLDCGACGGHAGDINARALAGLLNKSSIRSALSEDHKIRIPDDTLFVAAVHETVTDRIYLLDKENITPEKLNLVSKLEETLEVAASRANSERFSLRPINIDPLPLRRSGNWSEVRPEWGLAGNASFIVAPRKLTETVNLESRTFLHDYSWKEDTEFKTLELIMTAPMLVTNWINMQYYASTVAPEIYGAGNKVLHNIVNESGVFEGNGGDLRIGLPIQSVHDGVDFVHEPLRLSVFIDAPQEAIENIISRHETVRELVDNQWVHLFQIDQDDTRSVLIHKRTPILCTYCPTHN